MAALPDEGVLRAYAGKAYRFKISGVYLAVKGVDAQQTIALIEELDGDRETLPE